MKYNGSLWKWEDSEGFLEEVVSCTSARSTLGKEDNNACFNG